jgi:NAD(P)-dependent dehydrogenase (short-subunit alcohol dehydrogenase family)
VGRLEGLVCVVTGGARGLGAGMAQALGEEGARIALIDSDVKGGRTQTAALAASGIDTRFYAGDVAVERDVMNVAVEVVEDMGGVDVLVNNAGIALLGPSLSFPLEDWQRTLDVMATGVFLCSREFGAAIRDRGGGSIINIASLNGIVAMPMRLAYSAAKAAVISMTHVLATEWGAYGIRVNAIAPGVILTSMTQDTLRQGLLDEAAYVGHTPLGRFGEVEEIGQAAVFLASSQSTFVTGQVLAVDGGWSVFGWVPWTGNPEAPFAPVE